MRNFKMKKLISISTKGEPKSVDSRIFYEEEIEHGDIAPYFYYHTAISNIIWEDDFRHKKFFKHADFAILRMNNTLSLGEAMKMVDRIEGGMILTTKEHRKKKKVDVGGSIGTVVEKGDYFLVIIMSPERITSLTVYKAVMANLAAMFNADTTCLGGDQIYPKNSKVKSYENGEWH